MNALAVEVPSAWRAEPEGRGHELLQTWALYRRDASRHDEPRVERMAWKEQLPRAFDAEPAWIVLVDRAIGQLARIQEVYEAIVKRYYLDGQQIWQVAPKVCRTEGFVMMSLRGICDHVDRKVPKRLTGRID